MAQMKPDRILDILMQHPYFENAGRPSREWLHGLTKKHAVPMDEVEKAICNIIARPDEFPNPERYLELPGQAFKNGKNDIGKAVNRKPWQDEEPEWKMNGYAQAKAWFDGLSLSNQEEYKAYIKGRCGDIGLPAESISPNHISGAILVHIHKTVLDPQLGHFQLTYTQQAATAGKAWHAVHGKGGK